MSQFIEFESLNQYSLIRMLGWNTECFIRAVTSCQHQVLKTKQTFPKETKDVTRGNENMGKGHKSKRKMEMKC